MLTYQPLDASKSEIRLLYVVRHGERDTHAAHFPGLEFELRHASLDSYTDKARQWMTNNGSTTYSVKDYAWPHLQADTSIVEDVSSFNAQEVELDQLVTRPDFGRWDWGDYTTLSYTWGDPGGTLVIMVNGCVIKVNANLYGFLHSYATKHSLSDRMGLWVDAICINQGDMSERNVQVGRMRDIYSQAFGTIVWLGRATGGEKDSDRAMDFLTSLEPHLHLHAAREKKSSHGSVPIEDGSVLPTGSWVAFKHLLSRPYWSRLWIIQEIALSQDSPWRLRILCGDRVISWSRFVTVIRNCAGNWNNYMDKLIKDHDEWYGSSDFGDTDDLEAWTKPFERIQELCSLSILSHRPKEVNLSRMLLLSRTSQQTDPRDKVYGMLGLMNKRISEMLEPNYTLSKAEIFTDFARKVIQLTDSLDIITWQGIPGKERELPSWVPDMTEETCVWTEMSAKVPYRASQDSTATAIFRGADLIVRGIIVDRIDGRGAHYYDRLPEDKQLIQSVHSSNPYETEAGLRDAIWRTLLANRDSLGNTVPESCARILGERLSDDDGCHNMYQTAFFWTIDENSKLRVGGRDFGSFFWNDKKGRLEAPEPDFDYFARMSLLEKGRLLITTEKGYFGQARLGVMRGDLVCILLGCSVPVILRPRADGESYLVIGEAYVHGLMDGEAMDSVQEGKYRLEEICIR